MSVPLSKDNVHTASYTITEYGSVSTSCCFSGNIHYHWEGAAISERGVGSVSLVIYSVSCEW